MGIIEALALSTRVRPWSTKRPRIRANVGREPEGSALSSSRRAPADHDGFYASISGHALPSAVMPLAQEWDDIRACVIFAKDLQRLIGRGRSLIEVVDTFLPSDHGKTFSIDQDADTSRVMLG
jgi:hypothetical protein